MLNSNETPIQVLFQVDDKYMEEFAKKYLDELFNRFLKPKWLTIADMEKITRHKRKWIMEYIVNDPYVRRNELAKKDGDSMNAQWLFDSEGIRPFLKRLFKDLPNY